MTKHLTWPQIAIKVETQLHHWLGLGEDVSIIYLNRAAGGLSAALKMLKGIHRLYYEWPSYHAIQRISEEVGIYNCYPTPGPFGFGEQSVVGTEIYAPVALGGEAIHKEYWEKFPNLVYDCAQTCYRNMFKGLHFKDSQFAVLSFEQTKPLGNPEGGGALVCNRGMEAHIRDIFVPGNFYFNPRASQCENTLDALEEMGDGEGMWRFKRMMYNAYVANVENVVHDHTVKGEHNIFTYVYMTKKPSDSLYNVGEYAGGKLWRVRI